MAKSLCNALFFLLAHAAVAQDLTPTERALTLVSEAIPLYYQGNLEQAEQRANEAIQTDRECVEAHFWLARILATRAGTDPEARGRAIDHLNQALRIRPVGPDADLVQFWLVRLGGRPAGQTLIFLQSGEDDLPFNPGSLNRFITNNNYWPNWQSPEDGLIAESANPEELSALIANSQLQIGYAILFSPRTVINTRNGREVLGEFRVFDPITRLLFPPVRSNAILISRQSDNGFPALAFNAREILDRFLYEETRTELLDEVFFPTRALGVYARSAAPYETALTLPLVAIAPTTVAPEVTMDTSSITQRLSTVLSQSLLAPKKIAILPSTTVARQQELIGMPSQTLLRARLSEEIGARYIVNSEIKKFSQRNRNYILYEQTIVEVEVELSLTDLETNRTLHKKLYKQRFEPGRVLNNPSDMVAGRILESLRRISTESAKDMLRLIP